MTPVLTQIARGLTGARWRLINDDPSTPAAEAPELLDRLQSETGENRILLRCLLNRGLSSAEEVRKFLAPEFVNHLHSPFLLRDMGRAAERLRRAISDRERIMIVTDFDVDGTTSSVILSSALRLLGAGDLISCYIPDRFTEGYGLSREIVERAAADGFRIIVTADIGIKSHAEARLARELGIDLIICDHHLPDGEDVPAEAFAVLCPKGSSGTDYPNKHLAACGVSLKLADALLEGREKRGAILASLAKLAAIGTIADMVDLSASENRAIVAHGLQLLNQRSSNPGLRALLKLSQVESPITAFDVGFRIGPRINAAGRIAHADSVLALFDAKTDDEAMNAQRQHIQSVLVDKLKQLIESRRLDPGSDPQPGLQSVPGSGPGSGPGSELDRVLVFAGTEAEGFHRGVIGIACSKIVDLTGRPTFICSINGEGVAHGSARSVHGFHLVEALDAISDALVKYGGHPMAAGFTVQAAKIEEMRYRLNQHAAKILSDNDIGQTLNADAEITIDDATADLVRSLSRLEPHGIGNPQPLFLMRGLPLRSIQTLKEKHLKFLIGKEKTEIEALWWNAGRHRPEFAKAEQISLMCRPEINVWNGRENCQLKVIDAALE